MVDVAQSRGPAAAATDARTSPGATSSKPKGTATLKYKKYSTEANEVTKKLPSQHISELTHPKGHWDGEGWRPRPKIIELLNIADFTNQVQCQVPLDEPIFQPFPPEVLFHGYKPFKSYEATLHFRNNDNVPRRIKVVPPDTPYFSIKRSTAPGKDEGSKIAAGMEVAFTVTFMPESVEDYAYNLVVCTEREKFIVSLVAAGAAPALDLPDLIEFTPTPAKTENKQIVFVRNVGSQASSFALTTHAPFAITPSQGFLAPGETLQLLISFHPASCQRYDGELEVQFGNGCCVYSQLLGHGTQLDVGLSQEVVTLLPTYVTKMSQRSFKVVNNSGVPVQFSVKQHPAAELEAALRDERLDSLGATQAALMQLEGGGQPEPEDSEDEELILASGAAAVRRQIKPQVREALLDSQLFGDGNFQVLPAEGTVWPHSEMEVVVQFYPDYTRDYEVVAYVDMQGREERLPISIKAKGLGPLAVFSYDVLDVGDTYAGVLHQYEVELQNRGKIDVEFQLLAPVTPFGKKFSFEPDVGHLGGGEIQIIRIKLNSDMLGVFSEVFEWSIKGSSVPLTLQLKGRVTGPTYEVDTSALDFGVVSYGFRYTKDLSITNTSEIPMRFSWRVPEDGGDPREFQVVPQKGSILPGGKQKISVEFVSQTVQRYSYSMLMDIPLVGEGEVNIPIKAECAVPKLMLSTNVLEFGDCFLRYPYKRTIRLTNESKLPGKFEVLPQDPQSIGLAVFSCEPASGGIAALGEQELEISLQAHTLGRVQIPVRVRIVGSRAKPLEFAIDAKCLGPYVLFGKEESRTESTSISFEKVAVLVTHEQQLLIHNPTCIPATFKLFIDNEESLFSVEPREVALEPGGSAEATVRVQLDETNTFKDELHVLIAEGADMAIPLQATGTGNTLVSEELTGSVLDFGHQFVGRPFSKEVTVHNLGRRTMVLTWTSERAEEVKRQFGKAARSAGKKFDMSTVPADQQPVWSLAPDRVVLAPKESCVFVFNGLCLVQGEAREQLSCTATSGTNSKGAKKVFDVTLSADVAAPLLDFSERTLQFHHEYQKGRAIETINRPLTLKNISKLPISFSLKCPAPFTIDCPTMSLEVEEGATVNVMFDPNHKGDLQSAILKQKLKIEYTDNPQKDALDLIGLVDYPNLAFETTDVEFGSCLSDTTRRVQVQLTNCSNVVVVYAWAWDAESLQEDANSMASFSMKAASSKASKPPAVQLFDILPIKGSLRPGESEAINFSFFAYPGVKASAVAMCKVEGGPTYNVNMSGESNYIKYTVEPQSIDAGLQIFDKVCDRDLVINNQGKVPFDFFVNTSLLQRPGSVEPVPRKGQIGPGQKGTIKLKLLPGIPALLSETLMVEVAHFDPIPVHITMEGIYPTLSLNLPRARDDLFNTCLEQAKAGVAAMALHTALPMNRLAHASLGRLDSTAMSVASTAVSKGMSLKSTAKSAKHDAMSVAGKSDFGKTTQRSQVPDAQLGAERKLDLEAERLRLVRLLEEQEQAKLAAVAAAAAGLERLSAAGDDVNPQDQDQGPDGDEAAVLAMGTTQRLPAALGTTGKSTKSVAASGAALASTAGAGEATMGVSAVGKKIKPPVQPPLPALFSAHYILDFGNVAKGTTRTRKFRMVNPSTQALTLRFDKAVLENWCFKADPEAVSKLPGSPEFGSVEVTITLQANKPNIQLGPSELVLPLDIKGSLPVLLTLRANVQVPDLQLSQDVLDFSTVKTGLAKVYTLQLHNYKQVPCEWCIKRPVEASKAKDWAFFKIEPSEGLLEPDQKLNVRVTFTPVMGRQAPYQQSYPIRISLNHKVRDFLCKGSGTQPQVTFTPTFVDCGPILPKFDGQVPNEARFQMLNPCSFPVEVVSLDFDKQYLMDDEVLRGIDEKHYNETGVMYRVPLEPGQQLWPELVDEAQQRRQMQVQAEEAAGAEGAGKEEVGDLDTFLPAEAAAAARLVVVVHGPKLVGCSTQAALLSERYGVPAVTFDELLFEGADAEAAPPPPPPPPPAEPAAAAGAEDAAEPAAAEPAAYFDAEIAELLYAKVLVDPELEMQQAGYVAPYTKLAAKELNELLVRGVRQALLARGFGAAGEPGAAPSRFEAGLVLDSLRSRYCSPSVAARLLMEALGMAPLLTEVPAEVVEAPKGGAKGKPGKEVAPPPEPQIEGWTGPHSVHFVGLEGSVELVKERLRVRRVAEEEAAEEAAARVAEEARAAAAAAAAEARAAVGTPEPEDEGPEAEQQQREQEPEAPPSPEELEAQAAQAAAEAEAKRQATEAELQADAEEAMQAHKIYSDSLLQQLGKAGSPSNRVVWLSADPSGPPAQVLMAVCRIKFVLGQISSALPQLDSDRFLIPDPFLMQIVPRPKAMQARSPVLKFRLVTERDPTPEEQAAAEAEEAAAAAAAAAPVKGGKRPTTPKKQPPGAGAAEPPPAKKVNRQFQQSRWVIPANGAVDLVVKFQSEEIGKFLDNMVFEVLGGERINSVAVTGTCGIPQIATDYRNVFYKKVKARPQTPTIARQFIISKNMFEFGPLLMNKDTTGYLEGGHPDNTAKLRITNNGLFDLHVDFSLKSKEVPADVEPKKKAPAPAKGKGAPAAAAGAGAALDSVFVFHPASMDLKMDETMDLTLYGFPTADGPVEDSIICKIKDNPTPVEFPISVIGAKPLVLVYLDDGSPPPALPPVPVPGEKPQPPPPNKILTEGIQFGRLLVSKKDLRSFVISNPGLLPIKWRLAGLEQLPKELVVYPSSGELPARNDVKVSVEFSALEKRDINAKFTVEVLDKAELQGVASTTPIAIKGEAYKIEHQVNFPQPGLNGVDFGLVRVVDSAVKPITIKNAGKYQISFNFTTKSSIVKDVFSILPETGTVDPGKDVTVQIHFNKDKPLQRELTLVGNSDIVLSIIEPLTSNKEVTVPITVSVRAVFSKYTVTPARGINFGPVTYNTSSKPKTFEITNIGEFAYDFRLFNYAAPEPPPEAGKKAAPPPKDKKGAAGGQITVGQFTFEPVTGRIEPGASLEVSVVFKAESARTFTEILGIDVSDRDFSDAPGGMSYEVAGESCIPGIAAANTEAIFEEHVISSSLDPFSVVNNEFGLRERVFNMGAVVADLTDAAVSKRRGVRANLKFINPIKVPCTVDFSIKPRGTYPAGMAFPMEVDPPQLVIPPHEYRYATVVFSPQAIQQYSATFDATVKDGSDPATKSFSCEIRGEGTLPSLSLQEPNVSDNTGRPLLKFGRLLVGRTLQLRINLKNNGTMPASARLEAAPHDHFHALDGNQLYTVESKKAQTFSMEFRPTAVGAFSHEVQVKVQKNPFEDYRIALTGEAYQEDVTFDQLPNGSLDELRLADCPVGKPHQQVFVLHNHSSVRAFRFKWPAASPNLTFAPSTGHLLPGASKDIMLTFKADAPIKMAPQDVKMALVQVQHAAGVQPVDWDDRSTVLDYSAAEAKDGQPAACPEPEPSVSEVAGSAKDLLLKVFAVADNPRYECESKPIAFRPTTMFQTRSFAFPLKNTSSARMDYKFTVMSADGQSIDMSGMYSVQPQGGVIEPGEAANITVKFSPVEVEDCARCLVCDIPNLDASAEPLTRQLNGKVLRPWCHFDLPESDYISGGRRNPEMPGPSGNVEPLDPATKVLEIESLGIKVRNTKRFMVLNPTGIGYEFFWQPASKAQEAGSPFSCLTRRGTITGGRQFEMVFEYVPTSDTIAESFWTFRIPEQGIEVPFLLVGLVTEPCVFFDRPAINFGQVLIGGARGHAVITLVNNEHLPFQFSLDKNTYNATPELIASTGQQPIVQFEPSSGTVPPKSSLQLAATFVPRLEQAVNHNVVCNVKKKPTKLTLNVKGEGYAIHEALHIESANGSTVTLAPRQTNSIDFGQVIINERSVRAVVLINSGSLNYDFIWDLGVNPRLIIKPESGTVPRGERLVCELAYHPHAPDILRDYRATCQIVNGNKYTLSLNGAGHKPRLDLSFTQADFGPVYVFQQGMAPATRTLRLTNNDTLPITIDPQWTNTDEWQVDLVPGVLKPGQMREAMMSFKPSTTQAYSTRLPLEINGLYTLHVDMKGEGATMSLEVADPAKRTVNFGGVPRTQSSTRMVQVVNRGRVAVTFSAAPSRNMLERYNIDMLPAGEVTLRPRESAELTFFFRPQSRMRTFTEELAVDAGGVQLPLLTLTGACLGTELRLASDNLPFGPVVIGSRSVKRLSLENTGDVGTKFSWNTRALGENFSVFPAEGFLGPGQDVKLDVTFHPVGVSPDVRVERVRLQVEGGEDRFLTLTGACVGTSVQPEAVAFSCAVRGSAAQSISLHNPSSSNWSLRPTVQNEFFTGPEFVDVPAGAKVAYPVTFRPLTMSSPDQPHEGSIFFPIPDGTGLLYRLVGKADTPVPEGQLERTITAKVPHVEVLKVSNWLHKPQRMRVVIDRKQADRSTTLEGPEYVDIPALSSKDYKLTILSFTASTTVASVTFKNEASGEYSFYDLKLTAGQPPSRGSLSLECPVRTQTTTKVNVRNPLDTDVTMVASCSNKQVIVSPSVTVPANSLTHFEIGYRPLLVAEAEAVLRLESAELGVFEWQLKLAGLSTNPERSMTFNVPLGTREAQVFRFTHWLNDQAAYKCSFKSAKSAFECPPSVNAPSAGAAGSEVQLEVAFEPTAIGESIRDTLVISSPTAGEYEIPLIGRCVPPKPQGPVECGKGSGVVVFKNVFVQEAEFSYSIDNPAFTVPKPTEKIPTKKAVNINVSFKPDAAKGLTARTGKLTVACPSQTSSPWVFYLQASEDAGKK